MEAAPRLPHTALAAESVEGSMAKVKNLRWKLFKIWAKENNLSRVAFNVTLFVVAMILIEIYGQPMTYICLTLAILLYGYSELMERIRRKRGR